MSKKGLLPPWKFREAVCKVKRFPIPNSWPIYVGHDFGAANPAAMFYAVDPTTGDIFALGGPDRRKERP